MAQGGHCRLGTLLLWALLVQYIVHGLSGTTRPNEVSALLAFQGQVANPSLLGWSNETDPCQDKWTGISCGQDISTKASYIRGLNMIGLGLGGTLSPALGDLSDVEVMYLSNNGFTGEVPVSIGNLTSLQQLALDRNALSLLPEGILARLVNLEQLYIYSNPFEGLTIPAELSRLTQLKILEMTNTSLTGTIPPSIGSLSSLTNLSFAINRLAGPIPDTFGASLSSLTSIRLNNNNLEGTLPDSLGEIPLLSQAWLHGNSFSGVIPSSLGDATLLTDLKLNGNKLVGPVPSSLASLASLNSLQIQNNDLSGPIPDFLKAFNSSAYLPNSFCSDIPGTPCSAQVTALLGFLAGVNYAPVLTTSWTGGSPCSDWKGVTCDTSALVVAISLASLSLAGTVSPGLVNLTKLTIINLADNNLTGSVPEQLTTLSSLRSINLSNNKLSGLAPVFPAAVKVTLGGNNFTLSAPPLAPAPSPSTPPVSSPATPPAAPPSIVGKPPPVIPVTPPNSPAGAPPSLSPPSTSSPIVPPSPGATPSTFPPPPPITVAPASLPPTDPVPGSPPPSIAAPAPAPAPDFSVPGGSGKSGSKGSSFPVAAVVGPLVAVFIVAALVAFCCFCVYKRKRNVAFLRVGSPSGASSGNLSGAHVVATRSIPFSSSQSGSLDLKIQIDPASGRRELGTSAAGGSGARDDMVIKIEVIRAATRDFAEDNIVGRGGFGIVYQGELADGTKVAVKRMEHSVMSNKGHNEFQAEIAVLTKVRHKHLVGLLGYVIDGYERLLVYEYMSKGPLSRHLFDHAKYGLRPLDWKTRVSIALDVARGVEYLHGLVAHKSFIHRDLKPSNVLLDDSFRAKVADFGLVKNTDNLHSIETRLAGTFGYLAPEYAVTGKVTTKSDVYSFGIVLMELITGRRSLDDSQGEERAQLAAWFPYICADREKLAKAVDAGMEMSKESFEDLFRVADLAGHCCVREARQRPQMSDCVALLTPIVQQWKPQDPLADEAGGIDMAISLAEALEQWKDMGDGDDLPGGYMPGLPEDQMPPPHANKGWMHGLPDEMNTSNPSIPPFNDNFVAGR
eukprot:jgi/Mesen1/4523/ME000230S03669